jgi:hypothetical protein
MADYTASSFAELTRLIARHAKQREGKVRAATKRAARKAAVANTSIMKRAIPVAHGELRESVHVEGSTIIIDAPHAAAVNNGSRPHWVPLEALIEWVKLRGTQGVLTERQQARLPGSSTKAAAQGVAELIRQHEHRGPAGFVDIDAPVAAARAIQLAIAKKGTKPHHFIEKALPDLYATLGEELKKALAETP